MNGFLRSLGVAATAALCSTLGLAAQTESDPGSAGAPDVIQIVTFRFATGQSGKAIEAFRDLALPLYEQDPDLLEFRAYREVESPTALDLVVISRFHGMAGMDRSNATLRSLATETGGGIGAVYGAIGAMSVGHTDEFVEIAVGASLGSMDTSRLVVLEYLEAAETIQTTSVSDRTLPSDHPGVTGGIAGPLLVGDGWEFFRIYGVEALATVQSVAHLPAMNLVDGRAPVTRRKRIVLAPVPELAVR